MILINELMLKLQYYFFTTTSESMKSAAFVRKKVRGASAYHEAGEVDIRTRNLRNDRGVSDKDIIQTMNPATSIYHIASLW